MAWLMALGVTSSAGCGDPFTDDPPGTGLVGGAGAGGAGNAGATAPVGGSAGSVVTTTGGSHAGGTGGAGSSTAGAGGNGGEAPTGGGPACEHDVCTPGSPLSQSCEPCAELVCDAYNHTACCSQSWRLACVQWAVQLCGTSCETPCDTAFGAVPGYEGCDSGGVFVCKFLTTAPLTCAQICSSVGAVCTEAVVNPDGCAAVGNLQTCASGAPYPKLCTCTPT